jgi:hypothetical protein
MKHAFMYQLMMNMGQGTLIMMRILTSQSQPTHQKTATFFDLENVRNGDQYHPMLHIVLLVTDLRLDSELHQSSLYFILHLDTRIISWNDINKGMDLPHEHQQIH